MSIYANADTERMTFICGSNAKTSTSQYRIACISASMTVSVVGSSGALGNVIGVIDSFQSSSSEAVSVIMHGLAKVYMGTSCTAGDPLISDASGTAAPYTTYTQTSLFTGTTALTNDNTVLGTALQGGITNGAMMCFVNPQKVYI